MMRLLFGILPVFLSFAAQCADVYTVPKARRTPKADGIITAGEYAGAMTFTGAADWRGAYIANKKAIVDSRKTAFLLYYS